MKAIQLAIISLLFHCAAGAAGLPKSGIDAAARDPATRVQDDLFRAANGRWLDTTPIPAGKSYVIGVEINDITDARIRAIVEDLGKQPVRGAGIEQQIGDYHGAYLDTSAIELAGLAPMRALLAALDAVDSIDALMAWQGQVQGVIETPVWLRVFPDLKDPGIHRVLTWQGGLGLPDRAYYLTPDDARLARARQAYLVYLERLAQLAGFARPADAAQRVLGLEQQLAQIHWKREDTFDMTRVYNPMTPAALATHAPQVRWNAFLAGAGLNAPESITVTQPSAVAGVARLLAELPLEDWKLYFNLRMLDAHASVLPQVFRDARFAFRGTALAGATVPEARWQQGIAAVNGAMGEAVGQLYVRRHFSQAHKARVETMVANVMAAYRESIESLTWMTPATKAQALDKLSKMRAKIGFPEVWTDYSALVIKPHDALGNHHRAARFGWMRQAALADRKVDRRVWQFTPQTVDAMYDPMLNEIVFPAASLQPPFFDIEADDAANYGAIGANIGHEISHAFDQQGSHFDGDGVLRNWWSEADRKAFDQLGARLVAQFDAYEALPGKHVNGKLTLTENLADLAGMQVAYRAYQRALGSKRAPLLDGLSGAQRFFLAAAQFRRVKMRDEAQLTMLASDRHAPHATRANGPAVNTDAFHDAFATRPGDGMFKAPQERIRIW